MTKRIILLVMTLCCMLMMTGCSDAVKDTINAIDAIETAEYKDEAISTAEELYNSLTDVQKAKVTNSGTLHVVQAEQQIDKIGYISDLNPLQVMEEESAIQAANTLYNALPDEEKKLVTNAEELKTAVNALSQARTIVQTAQTFAEKLFTRFAKCFKHPESISLEHVWYATSGGAVHYFTFQFNVKNGLGIIENVYYSNKIGFTELTDKAISQWVNGFSLLGDGVYFEEGNTTAMDRVAQYSFTGVELDATKIQTYFQSNR